MDCCAPHTITCPRCGGAGVIPVFYPWPYRPWPRPYPYWPPYPRYPYLGMTTGTRTTAAEQARAARS